MRLRTKGFSEKTLDLVAENTTRKNVDNFSGVARNNSVETLTNAYKKGQFSDESYAHLMKAKEILRKG